MDNQYLYDFASGKTICASVQAELSAVADMQFALYSQLCELNASGVLNYVNAVGNPVKIKATTRHQTGAAIPVYGRNGDKPFGTGFENAIGAAVRDYRSAITSAKLCEWHGIIFKDDREIKKQHIGKFRENETVALLSDGEIQTERPIPPPTEIREKINELLTFCNKPNPGNTIARAAVADLALARIQPFKNGNSRVSGILADTMMTRAENLSPRFYSIAKKLYEPDAKQACFDYVWNETGDDAEAWVLLFINHLKECIAAAIR
ncbi:MAG: Fic family protein [Proteobacteria bacterium]|nr:Fic family protein [Pseudomonadota bacterium]